MAKMVDVLQISNHVLIQRTRRLPLAGRVLVAVGDAVQAGDVLAEAILPAGVITLAVDRGLGVSAEEADECALRKPGDALREGDLLAQCEGTLTRVVRAPADGRLIDFSHGKAVIATQELKVTVQAGMPGVVEDIYPEFGVKIRAEGSLVQGEWGNGGICESPLRVLDTLETEDGEETELASGEILVIPVVDSAEVFTLIRKYELAGLVTFWLSPALKQSAQDAGIPILVISGFGAGEVDPWVWELLQGCQDKLASLNANFTLDRFGERPELVIPGEGEKPESAMAPQACLAVGQRVRILTGAAMGQIGRVRALEEPLMFESGFAFPTTTVELASGAQVQVPQQDLVILGV
ncbi:hypothetical protein JR338_07875 [Chloroflexota bacterium]|nr:hypothetical protein JR338_07875 [Chloroflexota bacterium]